MNRFSYRVRDIMYNMKKLSIFLFKFEDLVFSLCFTACLCMVLVIASGPLLYVVFNHMG